MLHQPAEHRSFRQGDRKRARRHHVQPRGKRDGAHPRRQARRTASGRDHREDRRAARHVLWRRNACPAPEPCSRHQSACRTATWRHRADRQPSRRRAALRAQLRRLLSLRLLGKGGRRADHVHGAKLSQLQRLRGVTLDLVCTDQRRFSFGASHARIDRGAGAPKAATHVAAGLPIQSNTSSFSRPSRPWTSNTWKSAS